MEIYGEKKWLYSEWAVFWASFPLTLSVVRWPQVVTLAVWLPHGARSCE